MKELDTELREDLRASDAGRLAEKLGLVTWETSYPEDAPPIMRVYLGEEPEREQQRRRVVLVAVVRATFEYVVPVLWAAYAILILVA